MKIGAETTKQNEQEIKRIETEMEELNIKSSEREDTKKEEMDVGKTLKKNLMFEEKNISIFRICLHLSYKEEYIFMFLGLLSSIGSGVSMPLLGLLIGDSIGTFSNTSSDNTADKNASEMISFYSEFKHDTKVLVDKFLYIGIIQYIELSL